MINLIPPEGHKATHLEYVLRVGSVFGFLFAGVALCLTVALIPTFVLVSAQSKALENEVGAIKEKNASTTIVSEDDLKRAKAITTQLRDATSSVPVAPILDQLNLYASKDITFKTFIIDASNPKQIKIQAQGEASTRQALAKLKTSLESSSVFSKVNIPLADLARDVKGTFSIELTVGTIK